MVLVSRVRLPSPTSGIETWELPQVSLSRQRAIESGAAYTPPRTCVAPCVISEICRRAISRASRRQIVFRRESFHPQICDRASKLRERFRSDVVRSKAFLHHLTRPTRRRAPSPKLMSWRGARAAAHNLSKPPPLDPPLTFGGGGIQVRSRYQCFWPLNDFPLRATAACCSVPGRDLQFRGSGITAGRSERGRGFPQGDPFILVGPETARALRVGNDQRRRNRRTRRECRAA